MPGFREFLESPKGRYAGIAVITLGLAAAGYSIYSNVGSASLDMANNRVFIDAKTGQVFQTQINPGDTIPIKAPSGSNTGYEAERCYWTKDGQVKTVPTYVLLNSYKGLSEPTFCPDCGRLVKMHNPAPLTGSKPPPTKDQYDARKDRR
jgi:hypothetical protein